LDRPGQRVHTAAHGGHVFGTDHRIDHGSVTRGRPPSRRATGGCERNRPKTLFVHRSARHAGTVGRRLPEVRTDDFAGRKRGRRALRVRGHHHRTLGIRLFAGIRVEGRGQQQPRQRVRGQRY